jgi:hypothetical protein
LQYVGVVEKVRTVLSNALALVKNPSAYMTRNKDENILLRPLMMDYVVVIALVPLVGKVIGDFLFQFGPEIGYAIAGAIISYILDVLSVFVIGIVIWKLAPSFNTSTDQAKATVMAAYAYTPVFLVGILNIIPTLGYLAISGLIYGLYIFYCGLPVLLRTPADKTAAFTLAIIIISIMIFLVT